MEFKYLISEDKKRSVIMYGKKSTNDEDRAIVTFSEEGMCIEHGSYPHHELVQFVDKLKKGIRKEFDKKFIEVLHYHLSTVLG